MASTTPAPAQRSAHLPKICRTPGRNLALALPYILHLLPPAAAWVGGSRHVLWFASSLFVAAAVSGLAGRTTWCRVVAGALSLAVAFGNVLLAVSLLVQRSGFNIEFFAHANFETLALAAVALRPVLLAVVVYFLLIMAHPFLIPRAPTHAPTWPFAAAAVAGLALNAPIWSFGLHIANVVIDVQTALLVPKPVLRPVAPPDQAQTRSLLLIFAESLEATYSRTEVFGEDLTPNLTALAASGKQFTDMRQVSLTAWTTGAMVAAQCASPLSAGGKWQDLLQNIANGVSPEMEGATCLGDLLAAYGYRTVLMTGTAVDFGGMDAFHAAHGFVERLGFETLSRDENAARRKWGRELRRWRIEDESLFVLARAKLDELVNRTGPFALVLTTMDTHGPIGWPSASCGAHRGMIDAVRCADRLIAEFVKDVRDNHPDIVVALLTDHLMGSGGIDGEVMDALADYPDRRLRFVVWGPDIGQGVVNRPGTHFDVMPTMMDFLGFSAWTEQYLGASLLRFASPWFSHDTPLSLRVVHELPNIHLRPGDTVRFEPEGPVIDLAGRRLLATSKGMYLRDAVFAVRFDDGGAAAGFHAFDNNAGEALLHELEQWAEGNVIVGVSTNQAFNAFHRHALPRQPSSSSTTNTAFFAGRLGTERFVIGPLRTHEVIGLPVAARTPSLNGKPSRSAIENLPDD